MIIITNPHFSQYRVSRDSLPTQLSNLVAYSHCKVGQILRRLKNEQNNYTPNCIIQLKVSVDNYFVHIFEDGQDGTKFKIHSRLQPPLLLPKSKMKLSIRLFLNKFHLCSVFYRAKVLF